MSSLQDEYAKQVLYRYGSVQEMDAEAVNGSPKHGAEAKTIAAPKKESGEAKKRSNESMVILEENELLKQELSNLKQMTDAGRFTVAHENDGVSTKSAKSTNASPAKSELQRMASVYEEEKENLKRQIVEVNEHKKVLKDNVFQIQEAKQVAEEKVATLEEKVSQLTAALEQASKEDTQNETKDASVGGNEELTSALSRFEEEKKSLQAQLKSATEAAENSKLFASRLENVEEEKKTLEETNESLVTLLKTASETAAKTEEAFEKVNEKNEELQAKLESAGNSEEQTAALSKVEEEKKALEEKNEELQAKLESATNAMKGLVADARQVEEARTSLKQTNEELENNLKAAKEAMEGLVESTRMSQVDPKEKEELMNTIAELESKLKEQTQRLTVKEQQLQQHEPVKEKYFTLQKTFDSLEKAYNEIKVKNTNSKAELLKTQSSLNDFGDQFTADKAKMEKKIAELEGTLEETKKDLFDATHDINARVQHEVDAVLKNHSTTFKQKISDLEIRVKEATNEAEVSRKQLKESEITLRTNQRKLKTLEQKAKDSKGSNDQWTTNAAVEVKHEKFEALEIRNKRLHSFQHFLMAIIGILLVAYYVKA